MKKTTLERGIAGFAATILAAGAIAPAAFAEYSKASALFSAEFDGQDTKANWTMFGADNKPSKIDPSTLIKDGNIELTPNNSSYGCFGGVFDTPLDVKDKKKVIWETRIKFDFPDRDATGVVKADSRMLYIVGEDTNHEVNIGVTADGYFAYGGKTNLAHVSEYKMYDETWYTIRAEMNFEKKTMIASITDDAGNAYQGTEAGYSYGLTLTQFNRVCMPRQLTENQKTYIDYTRLWDDGFMLLDSSIADGTENVPADTGYTLNFSAAPKAETLNGITVLDDDMNEVPIEISQEDKKVNIFFPAGLKYETAYVVKVPDTVANTAGETMNAKEFSFVTEAATFKLDAPKAAISGNSVTSSIKALNKGTADRDIYILTVIYSNGLLSKMVNEKISVPVGTDKTLLATAIDITGITSPTAKAYVWNGISK